jgi:disulfide bond formation protein DsbB
MLGMHGAHPVRAPETRGVAPPPSPSRGYGLVLLAALGVAGSLALSLALDLRACPLCFYQRAFAMAALAALVVGATARAAEGALQATRAAAAVSVAGLVVAGFHVYLEVAGSLECPAGLAGMGTAPQQSLAFFVVLTAGLCVRLAGTEARALALPAVLGSVLGVASLVANPPLPPVPTTAYPDAPAVCRPPFRAP